MHRLKHIESILQILDEGIFKIGMCLPAGPYVSDDDVKYIVETIKENIIG